ncbi:MAG: hypothetical protein IPL43_14075 [Micropruina sp.]|nr:hypothetical protein [Micropruina sp.]
MTTRSAWRRRSRPRLRPHRGQRGRRGAEPDRLPRRQPADRGGSVDLELAAALVSNRWPGRGRGRHHRRLHCQPDQGSGGLPAAVVTAHPELADSVALVIDKKTAKQLATIMAGQVAVALYDGSGKLLDATGLKAAA